MKILVITFLTWLQQRRDSKQTKRYIYTYINSTWNRLNQWVDHLEKIRFSSKTKKVLADITWPYFFLGEQGIKRFEEPYWNSDDYFPAISIISTLIIIYRKGIERLETKNCEFYARLSCYDIQSTRQWGCSILVQIVSYCRKKNKAIWAIIASIAHCLK